MSKRFIGIFVLLGAALTVGACGSDASKSGPTGIDIDIESDSGSTPTGDVDGGVDAGAVEGDSGQNDGGVANNDLPPGCLAVGFETDTVTASRSATSVSLVAQTSRDSEGLTDDLYFFHRSANPETGTLPIDDSSFADCTNCLLIQTGCSDEGCVSTYMARSGSLELLDFTDTLRVRMNDLTLEPVTIDETSGTTVLDGDAYCIEELEVSAPIESGPCSAWPEPSLADTNCGEAPLTVTFDVSGFQANSDPFSYISIDFGDGDTFYSTTDTITSHTFQAGEWDVEIEAVGFIAGSRTTLTSPEQIRAY